MAVSASKEEELIVSELTQAENDRQLLKDAECDPQPCRPLSPLWVECVKVVVNEGVPSSDFQDLLDLLEHHYDQHEISADSQNQNESPMASEATQSAGKKRSWEETQRGRDPQRQRHDR